MASPAVPEDAPQALGNRVGGTTVPQRFLCSDKCSRGAFAYRELAQAEVARVGSGAVAQATRRLLLPSAKLGGDDGVAGESGLGDPGWEWPEGARGSGGVCS